MRRKHPLPPPFRALDPGLRAAEQLLADGDRQLLRVLAALPDEQAAAARLNDALSSLGAVPRLVPEGAGWRLDHVSPGAAADARARALAGVAELVVVGGWRRLKHCETCGAAYCDRTSGCTRRTCVRHGFVRDKLSS